MARTFGLPGSRLPVVIFLMGLVLSTAATMYVARSLRREARLQFDRSTDRVVDAIRARTEIYSSLLRSVAAFHAAKPDLTRDDFHEFVHRLQVDRFYPGVQGIGFALQIQPHELNDTLTHLRRAVDPNFRLWPSHPRDMYTAIVYLEPLDRRNQAAIGYDMFAEPTRRAAMERARDHAMPAATGKVTLVQEIDRLKQSGFLIYLPVYSDGVMPTTVADRRERLVGYVYSPFRTGDLLSGVRNVADAPELDLIVYDGLTIDPQAELYNAVTPSDEEMLRAIHRVMIAGRAWTVETLGPSRRTCRNRGCRRRCSRWAR